MCNDHINNTKHVVFFCIKAKIVVETAVSRNVLNCFLFLCQLFKKPLDNPKQAGGPILASEDMKAIFSSLPDIEAVHRAMSDDLQAAVDNWNENSCVGQLVSNYVIANDCHVDIYIYIGLVLK